MPHIILITIAIILLSAGAMQKGNIQKEDVHISTATQAPSVVNKEGKVAGTNNQLNEQLTDNTPTQTPKPQLKSPTSQPISLSISEWAYPDAQILNSSNGDLSLQTNTSPEVVSAWYKQKIQEKKLATNAFVSNVINGKTQVILKASGNSTSISVEIKNEDGPTTVTVSYTNQKSL